MLPVIALIAAVCLIASIRFHRRFRPNSSFPCNTLLGSLTFLAMWTPFSICIILVNDPKVDRSISSFGEEMMVTLTMYLAVASPLATITIRLFYKPIRNAILFRPAASPNQFARPLINLAQ